MNTYLSKIQKINAREMKWQRSDLEECKQRYRSCKHENVSKYGPANQLVMAPSTGTGIFRFIFEVSVFNILYRYHDKKLLKTNNYVEISIEIFFNYYNE